MVEKEIKKRPYKRKQGASNGKELKDILKILKEISIILDNIWRERSP